MSNMQLHTRLTELLLTVDRFGLPFSVCRMFWKKWNVFKCNVWRCQTCNFTQDWLNYYWLLPALACPFQSAECFPRNEMFSNVSQNSPLNRFASSWAVAPSYWNHFSLNPILSFCQKKESSITSYVLLIARLLKKHSKLMLPTHKPNLTMH